ncbi:hypothetical protein [Dactylosporangium sp. CS-033363]
MAVWLHDGKLYEVNQYYFGESDSWCYEAARGQRAKPDIGTE